MIEKLFNCGCFDYSKFIMSHMKQLSLSSDEAMLLIHMLNRKQKQEDISLEAVAKDMNVTLDDLDKSVTNLMERKYYQIYLSEENGISREAVSFDGFFTRVAEILEDKPVINEDELYKVIQLVQREFGRILSANDLDIVSSLVMEDRYTLHQIEGALEYMKAHYKVNSIKNLVSSLNRNHLEPKETKTPEFLKNFMDSIK